MAQHFCEVCGEGSILNHMYMVFQIDAFVNLNRPEIISSGVGSFTFRGQRMNYHVMADNFMNSSGKIGLIVRSAGHHLICSEQCANNYRQTNATYFNENILSAPIVKLPTEQAHFPYLIKIDHSKHSLGNCANCHEQFALTDKVYRGIGIRQFDESTGTHRDAAEFSETYDFVLTDMPHGETGHGKIYLYYLNFSDLDNPSHRYNFCTNECAHSYSIRNSMAFMFNDSLNKGVRKWIVPQMREINRKLKNAFEYRGVG